MLIIFIFFSTLKRCFYKFNKQADGATLYAQYIFPNYHHTVFAVKHRDNFITTNWRDTLHKYVSGIVTNKGAKPLAVGEWKDHIHILFGMPVTACVADLMCAVKASSSKWINEQQFIRGKFQLQEGYAAFSYAKSQRDIVINYIMNQETHHQTKSFREEYIKMLTDFDVAYDDQYLFEFYD